MLAAAKIMIDREKKELMQTDNEASIGCIQIKASRYNSQAIGNAIEGSPEPKDETNAHSAGMESENLLNKDAAFPNHGYNRPFYQQEFFTWPNFCPEYPDVHKAQHGPMNAYGGHFYPMCRDYPFPFENRIHHMPLKMSYQGYPYEFQYQEFQYFVVIDFEATCDKETKPHPQEIIEFPSVLVNSLTGQLEASFQTYVRPAFHQMLSDFCKELTGIQQIQVDSGVPLSKALLMHDKWLEDKGIKHKNFAVVTWGNWDCHVMLESECRFKRIWKPPYFNKWINLKVPFQGMFGGVRCNLKEAVELAGLAWEGRPHCGLDDARNTARLLALLMVRGFRFSITNSLMWHDRLCGSQPFIDLSIASSVQPQKLKEFAGPNTHCPPYMNPTRREKCPYCFCGVLSSKCIIRKPGPTQGRCFFGCGNWTASRRAACNYFAWDSP